MKTPISIPKRAILPLEPSALFSKVLNLTMCLFGGLGRRFVLSYLDEVEISGLENLNQGPALVLMNHSNPLDPLLLCFFAKKPIHFLITEPFMARSLRAYLMAFFGQITKRKLLNDTLPLRTMKKWCQQKGLVGMFPEGQFSWDGSPSPLQPGLKQLVDYLGVPVVTVRLYNGDHFWPAWAKKPRRTKIKIEIDKPIRISATDDVEAIIKNRIHIDPKKSVPYIANSHKDLALGLSAFVRYCHLCHTDQSLTDLGNFLVCNSCKKTYELSSSNALIPLETGPDSVTSIAEYWSQIKTYVEKKLLLKESLASLNEITLFDATQMDWHPITKGYIQYEDGKITINDWTLSLKEVLAYTLDWGDLILIRTERKRFALKMPGESRAIWSLVLDQSVKKKNDAIQTTTE